MTLQQRAEYFDLWARCAPVAKRLDEIDSTIEHIMRGERRYDYVAQRTPKTLPWVLIGLLHLREASLRWDTHLHNGDPLSRRTVNVPTGRPKSKGPWTWEISALDALKNDGLDNVVGWDIPEICFALEKFNGGGYRRRKLRSPYLWAASNLQQPGKYTSDHGFDPDVMDRQLGTVTILKCMVDRGHVALRALPTTGGQPA